VGKNQWIL